MFITDIFFVLKLASILMNYKNLYAKSKTCNIPDPQNLRIVYGSTFRHEVCMATLINGAERDLNSPPHSGYETFFNFNDIN